MVSSGGKSTNQMRACKNKIFFLVFILCYIFRSSNFFTVACLQCWNEHTLPMKSGGFLNHSDISLLWHTWPKRLVCFSLLIDCLLIISISLPFMCTIGCISITAVYNIYYNAACWNHDFHNGTPKRMQNFSYENHWSSYSLNLVCTAYCLDKMMKNLDFPLLCKSTY